MLGSTAPYRHFFSCRAGQGVGQPGPDRHRLRGGERPVPQMILQRAAGRRSHVQRSIELAPPLPTRVPVVLGLQRQSTVINVHFDVLSGSVVQVDRIDSKESIDKKFDVHCQNRMTSWD